MKRRKRKHNPVKPKRFNRRFILIGLTTALLAIAATTVVAKRFSGRHATSVTADATQPNYRTVRVAGQELQVDGSGQIRPLSPQDAQRLAEGLKRMLNKSNDGLVEVQHADGSVSTDLQGRFQNVTVARVNEDGTLTQSCIDNPEAAAAFFGIDPKLLGVESNQNQPAPARRLEIQKQ